MIIIYSPDLATFTEIEHAISIDIKDNYNDIGSVVLTLNAAQENINAAQLDGVIYDTYSGISAVVLNVEIDADAGTLTINGRTCNALLNRRVFATSHAVQNIESDIYTAIAAEKRGLNVEISTARGLTETADGTLYNMGMLDAIKPILDAAELGQRCKWNAATRQHVFEIYKGTDRTTGYNAITFSDIDGTAAGLQISDDISEYSNVCYVNGNIEDVDIQEVVGSASGADRREVIIEGVTHEQNETEADYRARLRQSGAEAIAERVRRKSFTVTIDPSEYGTTYFLGDIVNCVSHRFSFSFTARITGVERSIDTTGETMALLLGDPKLTIIDEVKLRWQV